MPSIYALPAVELISRTLLWSHAAPTDWVARPMMVESDGVWVAIHQRSTDHASLTALSLIHVRFSINQGITWSDEDVYYTGAAVTNAPISPHSTNFAGEAHIAKAPNGDLLIHVTEATALGAFAGTYQWRSTNGGASWTSEGIMMGGELIAIDHDGGMIIGADLYINGRIFTDSTAAVVERSVLYVSHDNGATYEEVSNLSETAVDESTGEGALEWLGEGRIFAFLRGTDGVIDDDFIRYSEDLGLTWGAFRNFSDERGGTSFERMRVQRFGKRLYMIGRARPTPLDLQVTIAWSDDDGETWTYPFVLNPATLTDGGYCTMLRRGDRTFYMLAYEGNFFAGTASIYAYVLDIPSHTKELDGWAFEGAAYVAPPPDYLMDFSDADNSMYVGVM